MSTPLTQAQLAVEQLRAQATLERIKVSEASQDLCRYVTENEPEDALINPTDNNPFKDKSRCVLL